MRKQDILAIDGVFLAVKCAICETVYPTESDDYVAMAIAAMALLGAGAVPELIVVFVLFQGAGFGVTSILRPVLVAELLGRRRFGVVAGMLAVPFLALFALAPTIAGIVWSLGGYDAVIGMAGAAAVTGLVALALASRATDRPDGPADLGKPRT